MSQSLPLLRSGFVSASALVSLSITILAYKRAIEPLYASAPTQSYLSQSIFVAAALGSIPSLPLETAAAVYGTLLALAPQTAYWVALYSARYGDAVLGPAFTHAVVLVPLIAAGICTLQSTQGTVEPIATRFTRLPFYCFIFPSLEPIWNLVRPLLFVSSTEIFITLAGIIIGGLVVTEVNAALLPEPAPKPEKGEVPAIQPRTFPRLLACVLATSLVAASFQYAPTLHPRFGVVQETYTDSTNTVRILSSVQSNTGMIVVGEALALQSDSEKTHPNSLRYLRASHSLLGGLWIDQRAGNTDEYFAMFASDGKRLGDSIYTTFVLQEAVRLVNSTSRGNDWSNSNALVIGVGAGVAPTALQKHGISTTIVEIDPAVYSAARTYFGLPDPGEGKVFLEDARGWVIKRRDSGTPQEGLDIVIHDCFSGGGVPAHLFTLEFFEELKSIIKPDGIVAINFVGQAGSKSSRAVVSTLMTAFGQCRAFFDSHEDLPEEELKKQTLNLVFFCTPTRAAVKRLTFRPSAKGDYLGSHLREYVLRSLPKRELDLHLLLDSGNEEYGTQSMVLTDASNPLGEWQQEEAVEHWKLMRDVLPDVFWETF